MARRVALSGGVAPDPNSIRLASGNHKFRPHRALPSLTQRELTRPPALAALSGIHTLPGATSTASHGVHLLLPPPVHRPLRRRHLSPRRRAEDPVRLQGAEAGRRRGRGLPARRARAPRRRRGRRRQGGPGRRRLRRSSERVREAQDEHGLHRVQRRRVQAADPVQVEPQQGARVPRPGAPLRGQLRRQQQRLRHDHAHRQEDHRRLRITRAVPLQGGLHSWQERLRRQDRLRGRVRVRRGGHRQHPGELGARGRRQAVLQHLGADQDGGRRRGRQAPAHHGHRRGRQALHLQGAGRRQEVVQGRQEGRREGRQLLQRRVIIDEIGGFRCFIRDAPCVERADACALLSIVHENKTRESYISLQGFLLSWNDV